MGNRQVLESPVERGVSEEYPYSFLLTGKFPSGTYDNPQNLLFERDVDGRDFTTAVAGVLDGSPEIADGIFTTSNFIADELTPGKRYRLQCIMDLDGKQWDWELYIDARN
jgi:hypothetical protein